MNLVIIGAGGHAGVIIDAVHRRNDYRIVALLDDKHQPGEMIHGYEVKGKVSDVQKWMGHNYFIAVGDNSDRLILWSNLRSYGLTYVNVVHPRATICSPPKCVGTFFAAGSHVGPNSTVGSFSIMNTHACLEHDSRMGEFSHMGPCSVTGGSVSIGDITMIGLGAILRDGVTIGRKTKIGMGSVVTGNIGDNCVAYGNPARVR